MKTNVLSDTCIVTSDGLTPLCCAAFYGRPKILSFLISLGVNIDAQSGKPMRPAIEYCFVPIPSDDYTPTMESPSSCFYILIGSGATIPRSLTLFNFVIDTGNVTIFKVLTSSFIAVSGLIREPKTILENLLMKAKANDEKMAERRFAISMSASKLFGGPPPNNPPSPMADYLNMALSNFRTEILPAKHLFAPVTIQKNTTTTKLTITYSFIADQYLPDRTCAAFLAGQCQDPKCQNLHPINTVISQSLCPRYRLNGSCDHDLCIWIKGRVGFEPRTHKPYVELDSCYEEPTHSCSVCWKPLVSLDMFETRFEHGKVFMDSKASRLIVLRHLCVHAMHIECCRRTLINMLSINMDLSGPCPVCRFPTMTISPSLVPFSDEDTQEKFISSFSNGTISDLMDEHVTCPWESTQMSCWNHSVDICPFHHESHRKLALVAGHIDEAEKQMWALLKWDAYKTKNIHICADFVSVDESIKSDNSAGAGGTA